MHTNYIDHIIRSGYIIKYAGVQLTVGIDRKYMASLNVVMPPAFTMLYSLQKVMVKLNLSNTLSQLKIYSNPASIEVVIEFYKTLCYKIFVCRPYLMPTSQGVLGQFFLTMMIQVLANKIVAKIKISLMINTSANKLH